MPLLPRSSFILSLLLASGIPALAKEKRHTPAKPPAPPKPAVHQFFAPDDMLTHLSAVTDRSGRMWPNVDYSAPGDPDTPQTVTGVKWEPAPQGMDYHEEILGTWQGMQILVSRYHQAGPPGPNDYLEETTVVVVSFAGADGVMHPFFCGEQDCTVPEVSAEFAPPARGRALPAISTHWDYSGSGHYHGSAFFILHPDGPHLQTILSSGRHVPDITLTYDLSGHLRSTRMVWE